MKQTIAYEEGVEARARMIDLEQNPYPIVPLNRERGDWSRGWREWDETLRKNSQAHKASRGGAAVNRR